MTPSAAAAAAAPPPAEQHRHLAGVMCGAFTVRQANAAARTLGFSAASAEGCSMLHHLRLLCLGSIAALYSERKERRLLLVPVAAAAAPAPAAI